MSPARYAPLPNPRTTDDAEAEMHAAFELDDEDEDTHSESAPLTKAYRQPEQQSNERPQLSLATPGPATYDFEREYDYDYPPPGSPPPNAIGNSNGVLPSTPVRPPTHNRPTFFRRVVGALLPQHYQAVPTEPTSQRAVGGGQENDGVFANVMAKPGRAVQVQAEDGSVYMVPEETQGQAPPSYSEAQADAVPQYWETTVHAPSSLDPNADMIVDDLPTGSWYLFAANVFISWFFQFIGFLFTYLLHTTHAAKYGSRVGLGITLIQFGFYSRRPLADDAGDVVNMSPWNNSTSNSSSISHGRLGTTILPNGTIVEVDMEAYDLTSRDWVAFLLMTLGWFLLLSSLAGFFRVKRWERSIRSAAPQPVERATEAPQVLTQAYPSLFGSFGIDHEQDMRDESQMSEAELRLARDLRAAGLI